MKDHLHSLVRSLDSPVGRNILREYLRARLLEGLRRAGAISPLSHSRAGQLPASRALLIRSQDGGWSPSTRLPFPGQVPDAHEALSRRVPPLHIRFQHDRTSTVPACALAGRNRGTGVATWADQRRLGRAPEPAQRTGVGPALGLAQVKPHERVEDGSGCRHRTPTPTPAPAPPAPWTGVR